MRNGTLMENDGDGVCGDEHDWSSHVMEEACMFCTYSLTYYLEGMKMNFWNKYWS